MLDSWLAAFGEAGLSALGGCVIGLVFGFAAQRSRFCLRAATIDFWRGVITPKVSVWILAFGAAVLATQSAVLFELIDPTGIRSLNARGSLSGALIGGAMFGCGMVLTRGCASRLLVLSANGNLRALLSGLIFAVVAQASFRGMLSPAREALAEMWTVSAPHWLNGLEWTGAGVTGGLFFGLVWFALGLSMAWRQKIGLGVFIGALVVGLMVAAGWAVTSQIAAASFDPQPVKSLSFSGPSANLLMMVLAAPGGRLDFDTGLVPGVVAGSFLSALAARELKLEGFHDGASMWRYIIGASLMGFGAMLAGGCAIGAGVSGASLFATISWVTLFAMWFAAGMTDLLLDRPRPAPQPAPEQTPDPAALI